MSLAAGGDSPELSGVLQMLAHVMRRLTVQTNIGRILMPGPTYLGMWARDTGVACLGLNRLGQADVSRELLDRYWQFQIDDNSDPSTFIFRNKRFADWTEKDSFEPSREQLLAEAGAFPTSVYIDTPDFPAGTREIYAARADPDSACWLVIALQDYHASTGDLDPLFDLADRVERAVNYLRSRDSDGDHLLEQGANEDWADILLRHGKVSYTQAVWFRCLQAAADIMESVGRREQARSYRRESQLVRDAINRVLLTAHGYYANFVSEAEVSLRRALDTALLIAFGIPDDAAIPVLMGNFRRLEGPFGPSVIEPGYAPDAIGPGKYPPGQYHNEGVWPWTGSYLALAWARAGNKQRAADTVAAVLGHNPTTIHEWVDNLNGDRHHPDFATGAGALAWAITEGGLAEAVPQEVPPIDEQYRSAAL